VSITDIGKTAKDVAKEFSHMLVEIFIQVCGTLFIVGNWKNGKRDGKGTYIFAGTGIKYVGMWSEGNFVQGKWLFPNGTFFEGGFEGNQPKGKGIRT
jgi:hypothetical protein